MKAHIEFVSDQRQTPRIKTSTIFASGLVMGLAQLGSLNALEQTKGNIFWKGWIGDTLPSADTIGRVFNLLHCDDIRRIIKCLYRKLKRNKVLKPAAGRVFSIILDGHESSCSYLCNCKACLKRTIHTKKGDRIQYYHRNVMAQLWCEGFCLPLDMEPQRPGENETACAMRLLERVVLEYSRAFDLILVDGLYVRAPFFKLALKHNKDVIAVLKDERRDLLKDAYGVFKLLKPVVQKCGEIQKKYWDVGQFTSWEQVDCKVRVVRSVETKRIIRQRTKEVCNNVSEWVWVSTTLRKELSTEDFIKIAHGRWRIENNGFNELSTYWHADHVYRHDPVGIEAFWLLTMLSYIIFHAFINRNLKPEIRIDHTKLHWARVISAELYRDQLSSRSSIPP